VAISAFSFVCGQTSKILYLMRRMSHYIKGSADLIAGPLFAHQQKLKFLPVPSLEETCDRFLKTCLPLAKSSEEFSALKLKIQALKDGMGPKLQQRLLARESTEKENGKSWLIDWWNDYAYMSYRDPVVIWVNYFFAFCDDKRRMNPSERAASIVQGALSFKDLVVSGELSPEATKSGPLCSEQYK
jgi:carnitine O-acetyltransferase